MENKRSVSYLQNKIIGLIEIVDSGKGISEINFLSEKSHRENNKESQSTIKCKKQLQEYFAGKRKKFDIELDIIGSEFQKKVWDCLMKINYGERISYSEEAIMFGNRKASRAVANANAKNKIPIIIPCHRVILKSGLIGGYSSGGIFIKEYLLELEEKNK